MTSFKEQLRASMKSKDTEERIDIWFTRPVGLALTLVCERLGIHPNAVTLFGMALGIAAGWMFAHTGVWYNVAGMAMLMMANFCDSADGQLARLTGKTSLLGRVLDGFSGDLWFTAIYIAIMVRLWGQYIPGTTCHWGIWICLLTCVSGILCHSPQSSLADYYRQIHLHFLKGAGGGELDSYAKERAIMEQLPRRQWFARLYHYCYSNYCKSQERRTPCFQALMGTLKDIGADGQLAPGAVERLRKEFLAGSRPLMKYTNFLTFNSRAILIYVTCIAGCPYIYLLMELTAYNVVYVYMRRKHEALCRDIRMKAIAQRDAAGMAE